MTAQAELPFSRVDEFAEALELRGITGDPAALLLLMFRAVIGYPAAGIAGQFLEKPAPLFVIAAGSQQAIAAAAEIRSDSAVRTACRRLESLGILERRTNRLPSGGSETAYFVHVGRLIDLPKPDTATAIGRAVSSAVLDPPFRVDPPAETLPPTPAGRSAGRLTGRSAGRSTVRPAGRSTGAPPVPRSMLHENKQHACMQHESVKFSQIPPEHIRRIVGKRDHALFRAYWQDVVAAGWARGADAERLQLAALFHQVDRVGRARNPGATIASAWKDRTTSPLQLSAADEDFARKLLEPVRPDPLRSPAAGLAGGWDASRTPERSLIE